MNRTNGVLGYLVFVAIWVNIHLAATQGASLFMHSYDALPRVYAGIFGFAMRMSTSEVIVLVATPVFLALLAAGFLASRVRRAQSA